MLWTLRYYIGIPVAWQWYYDYTAAPAFSDFRDWKLIINDISFDGIPTTLEQLLLIMPRTSMHLLPKKYQIIMSNIALFPPEKEIKYCIMNKKYLHEAICYLPELKLSKIKKMIALLE
jgi:5'-3' exonuclease